MAKIIIFGAGVAGKGALERLSERDEVVCFLDNDPKKHQTEAFGHPVRAPADLSSLQYDYILIGSMYHREIKQQLLGMGVPESRIVVDPELLVSGNEVVSWGCFGLFVGAVVASGAILLSGVVWWILR